MLLGINTLGHLIEFTINNKSNDLSKSLLEATEACLHLLINNL
jgi:hypothetical protein